MPHKAQVTQKIMNARVNYLWGQVRRDNIHTGADIDKKIRSNLPVKEDEVATLRENFIDYARNRGWYICDRCDRLDDYAHFMQHGMTLCENCVNDEEEAEEL
jgi:hypothetical protein